MRADKAKVVDEVWDEARIDSFVTKQPYGTENSDYSKLLHAYRSMRVGDFRRFIDKFTAAGGDVSAQNEAGQTLAQTIATHQKSTEFVTLLNR